MTDNAANRSDPPLPVHPGAGSACQVTNKEATESGLFSSPRAWDSGEAGCAAEVVAFCVMMIGTRVGIAWWLFGPELLAAPLVLFWMFGRRKAIPGAVATLAGLGIATGIWLAFR